MSASADERVDRVAPARRARPDAADEARLVWLRRAVWAVLLAGVLAFLVQGADNPPDPLLVPAPDTTTTTTTTADLEARIEVEDERGSALPATTLALAPSTVARSSTSSSAPAPAREAASAPAPALAPPTTPPPLDAASPTVVRRPLPGFGQTAFRVTDARGGVVDGVALLAADQPSRQRGLMEQSDLRGYDAMVFRFPSPTTGTFFMRNTRIPLSIAFFDLHGRFVSAADMEPCPDDVADCPTYAAARPYLHAVEVAQGDLARFGIGPGSVLSFPSP